MSTDLTGLGAHQRYKNYGLHGDYTVAATTTVCPECGVGKLQKAKRAVSARDLRTRIITKGVIEVLVCRKCGCSFYIQGDVQADNSDYTIGGVSEISG